MLFTLAARNKRVGLYVGTIGQKVSAATPRYLESPRDRVSYSREAVHRGRIVSAANVKTLLNVKNMNFWTSAPAPVGAGPDVKCKGAMQ